MISRQPPSLARRLRLVVFPRGSVRERVAFLMKVSVLEVRHGPRAWWSAVRTAGRLLLPRPTPGAAVNHAGNADAAAAVDTTPEHVIPRQFAGEVPGLVSVILPVYNQATMLGDAIASVLAQTYQNLELIVLSDGSTDGAEAVFDRFAHDRRVRFLVQANQKLPRALSNAFDFARGEFWTWTSADNLMEPRHLEREVEFLQTHPEVDFVYANYIAIDDRGEPLRNPAFRPHNRRTPQAPEIYLPRDLSSYNDSADNFIGPCFMYRGSAGKLLGDYAPELGVEDYDYWLRMNTVMRIAHLGTDEMLYRYRVHDNSLCAQAVELGIQSRKDRLLDLDRRRREQLARGWRVAVAPELTALRPADGDPTAPHVVHLVPAQSLAQPSPAAQERTIAWFDGRDAEAPYRLRLSIDRAEACLSSDPTTADRLALFTGRAFVVRPERAAAFAVLHARSRFLREFEQSPEQRRRVPPKVRLPGGRELRVMLQVDDFAQGGLEQVVLDLAHTLREERRAVQLLVVGNAGDAAARATALGIKVVRLDRARQSEHYRELLRQVDVVNAHYSTFGAELAAAAGIPFVQTVHNTYVWMNAAQVDALRRTVPATTAFVCVSAEAARYSDVVLGIPPGKLIVLENGIEIAPPGDAAARAARHELRAQLGLAPDDFAFLQVASIYPPKAQRVAVQALHAVRPSHPRAKLLCAGRVLDEAYRAQLQADIERLGLTHAVHLLGFRADVSRLLTAADAFLLPSYWEGWSLAVAEAAVAGLPLVLSEVGAAREQIAVAGGRAVPPPFASITELRGDNLGAWIHEVQPTFATALAAAMRDAVDGRVPRPNVAACRGAFDRRIALQRHTRLFAWLAMGGALTSARAWLRNSEPLPSA